MARNGELKYLNLNTTYNSSILLNYRQTETAFWMQVNISYYLATALFTETHMFHSISSHFIVY